MQGIADYEFSRPLGSGNHGHVFLARRPPRLPVDVEYVAVKVLGAESTADTFRRATREMTALVAARSPYLITLHDSGQHDGIFYYSMEYLPDGSLAPPVDRVRALRAVADAARAAADLHAAGMVHANIKPSNVLLASYGAKLSDPDLAHVFTPGVTLTGRGPVASIEYTDPAVLRGEPPGPHHDVWSIGAMLHRVAAGTGVYGDLRALDGLLALRRVLNSKPEISPVLAAPIAELVRECLAEPSQRPAAGAVADRLAGAAG